MFFFSDFYSNLKKDTSNEKRVKTHFPSFSFAPQSNGTAARRFSALDLSRETEEKHEEARSIDTDLPYPRVSTRGTTLSAQVSR